MAGLLKPAHLRVVPIPQLCRTEAVKQKPALTCGMCKVANIPVSDISRFSINQIGIWNMQNLKCLFQKQICKKWTQDSFLFIYGGKLVMIRLSFNRKTAFKTMYQTPHSPQSPNICAHISSLSTNAHTDTSENLQASEGSSVMYSSHIPKFSH